MSICLHGGYYYDNFGDVLLFKIYAQWLREEADDELVCPLIPKFNRSRFLSHLPQVRTGLRSCDTWKALIYAGGGHFAQPTLPKWKRTWNLHFLRQHYFLTEWCIRKKIPYAVFGVGAGPVFTPVMRNAARRIFRHAAYLTVRDEESRDFIIKDLGVERPVTVVPDAAVTLAERDIPAERIRSVRERLSAFGDKPLLGIHLTESFFKNSPKAVMVRDALLAQLERSPEIQPVVFTDYGQRHAAQMDWLSLMIEQKTKRRCVSWSFTSVEDLLALLSQLSAVVTPKLHVGIAAYAFGKYVESFATDIKIPRFYRLIERARQCDLLEDLDGSQIEKKILRVFDAVRQERRVNDEAWRRIKREALKNETLVNDFLDSLKPLRLPAEREMLPVVSLSSSHS